MSDPTFTVTNQLLHTLHIVTNQRLLPYLQEVSLVGGQVLQESGTKVSTVYFPQSARLSLLLVMSNRSSIEITSIGNEGLVGLSAILGCDSAHTRTITQISGKAIAISADLIQKEFLQNENLRQLLLLYTQTRLNQISQLAVCRSHHDIEQRLACWLLLIYDNAQYDKLPLTQKFISLMLGVRRASITEIAISLQKKGIIKYSRGQITILNPSKLQSISCECYDKIKCEYQRLLEPKLLKKN